MLSEEGSASRLRGGFARRVGLAGRTAEEGCVKVSVLWPWQVGQPEQVDSVT